MKKAILTVIISSIFIITLIIAPLGLNADVEIVDSHSIDFFIPHSGITKIWTNPDNDIIDRVTVKIYHISDPSDWWTTSFTEDGTKHPVTVKGIGTPDITVTMASGSMDSYRAKVTFIENQWIRDHRMVCKMVWVNEDNNFEFIFDYYYANNNIIKIYDMDGNMVWETDFAHGKNRFIAELPDGMYTVKTYHDQELLQEFMIGKP